MKKAFQTWYRRLRFKYTNTLIIDRREWARGPNSKGELLDANGQKCCLGFHAIACGRKESDIEAQALPSDIASLLRQKDKSFHWLLAAIEGPVFNENAEGVLAGINDDGQIIDDKRERKLQDAFMNFGGITVKFVH